ncbi:MAG: FG-GAP repeat protein [Planctomycetes bacterium]|nr:FG-GAP repeat protein [Planctomycetota bacterium]
MSSLRHLDRTFESRRTLYRRSRRVLVGLLGGRWPGRRPILERAVRCFLRDRPRGYLARVVADRGFALAAAATLAASTTATALPPVNLSDVAAGTGGFVINGIDTGDVSGVSVSGAGDVNGDGLADLIVGAFRGDPGGNIYAGESYVVFGKADTTPVCLEDVVAGSGGFVINGIDPFDFSGLSVSGAGDVNGDGLADLIVGAPRADPGGNHRAGESYVVFGKADTAPVSLADIVAGTGGFVINGNDTHDSSGHSVSGAGDVNGDGLADLIVGAPSWDYRGNFTAGESYVVFGKADTAAVNLSDVAAGTGGFVINGIDHYDRSGWSVSGAGDVNGDGLADLIVGTRYAEPDDNLRSGESYVVFGKADTAPVSLADIVAGTGGFVINGVDAFDYSGRSVSGAGDVNGDGLADLIVGAARAVPGGNNYAGESYVVFGKAGTTPVNLADVVAGSGGFVINGIDPYDRLGYSVSAAGDVNGDGLADLIVGAWSADPGGNSSAGESYVVLGKADTAAVNLSDVAAGAGGFVINGIDPGDMSGFSVSGAGDVNGDGLTDLIVGAHHGDPGGNSNAGESYVIFSPFVPPCPWDLDGDGNVFITDLLLLLMDFGSCDGSPADFDGDGCVTVLDLLTLLFNFGPCPDGECPWDVTGDGTVDLTDLWQVLGSIGSPCDTPAGCPEDVNGDGVVDVHDVVAVITHFGPCP